MSMRKIIALQLKKYTRKGCPLYTIQVIDLVDRNKLKIEDHPVLHEFEDELLEEVLGFPPK
jgi:hypothetical protein